ncbi:MAG: right-handed parallel beta-helix repeat-containing protein, partial [Planctomycetota bacterium]
MRALVVACALAGGIATAAGLRVPELPRQRVDTTMPEQAGQIIEVAGGGDLQKAIDQARPGDTVVAAAGATFTATLTLPKKEGEGWIVVMSSAADKLPPPGTRVTPADAKHMPRVVTNRNGQPALRTRHGAHHYRFIGIEFAVAAPVKRVYAIVEVSHRSTKLADVPSHVIFDRVYIHGRRDLNSRRGLTLNSRRAAVIDSWIDECHTHGADSQAIVAWNGPGPLRIENCFLEGGSENIMFGGAKNSAETMVPSDIEIRRCHFYKNPAWAKLKYPSNWAVKNLFEIKTARRVLLEGNVFENCWAEAQTGFAFVLKSSSPSQGRRWDTTSDITIRYNRILNCVNGMAIARWSSSGPVKPGAEPTSRILIEHNVFERFGSASDFPSRGGGRLFQIAGRDYTIRHNTAWPRWNMISLTKPATDNLMTPGSYGVKPDGRGVGWNPSLGTHIRGNSVMRGNAIIRVGSERARRMDPKA